MSYVMWKEAPPIVVFRCKVRFTVEVDVESVCNVKLVLPSAKVAITPDAGFAVARGIEANKLETINNTRITERVALACFESRGRGMTVGR